MKQSMDISQIVKREEIKISRDSSRVIALPHIPSELPRIGNIILRVLKLTKKDADRGLSNHGVFY